MLKKIKRAITNYIIDKHRETIHSAIDDCKRFNYVLAMNVDEYRDMNEKGETYPDLHAVANKLFVEALASHIVGQYLWWTSIDRKTVYRYAKHVLKNAVGYNYIGAGALWDNGAYYFTFDKEYQADRSRMLLMARRDMKLNGKDRILKIIKEFKEQAIQGSRLGQFVQVRYNNPETRENYSFWILKHYSLR